MLMMIFLRMGLFLLEQLLQFLFISLASLSAAATSTKFST